MVDFADQRNGMEYALPLRAMRQNVSYALRSLLRTPTFTFAALVCLTLGIGATTAIFSIVSAVLFRPLPYKDPARLVRIYTEFPSFPGGLHRFWVSEPEVFELQSAKTFDEVGAWAVAGANISGNQQPIRVTTAFVSSGALHLLGIQPALGRLISPEDDKPGAPQVVVISQNLWRNAFGHDPQIVGRQIYLNNSRCSVVGVMPSGFVFPPGEADAPQAWTALQLDPKSQRWASHQYSVLARLRPGVSIDTARAEMDRMVAGWGAAESPNNHVLSPRNHPVSMYGFYGEVVGSVRRPMIMLLLAVAFVLLIACVNVANLLLARSEARQREIAIRRAIGGSNAHLIKQFIVEGTLLSLGGGTLGIVLAVQVLRLVRATSSGDIPRIDELSLDWRVLLFAFVVCCFTGILFGLAPLIHTSAIRVHDTLKNASSRSSATAASNRFRRTLVVAELALAFVLLSGAGLMLRGLWRLQQVNAGFNPHALLTVKVSLPEATYKSPEKRMSFWTRLQRHLAQIPGVESATMIDSLGDGLPPIRPANQDTTEIEGFVKTSSAPLQNIAYYSNVGDRFFETMGIRLMEGRFLAPQDGEPSRPGVVINATMARTFWPNQSSIGRRIRPGFKDPWFTIVGVVADVKNDGLDKPADTEAFFPYRLAPYGNTGNPNVIVKTRGNPLALAEVVRRAVSNLDPSLPVAKIRTMEGVIAAANARPRFLTMMLSAFSLLALGLAVIGIYGVISYSVEQRTTEFGVKMALGASPRDLLNHVVRQGLALAGIGVCIGAALAILLTQSLEGLVFGLRNQDQLALLATASILTLCTAVASMIPAVRAMRVEPVAALRYE
jgi:putative ABC transport system permease protein